MYKNLWSPVVYYLQNGRDKLLNQLQREDIDYLRAIATYYNMIDSTTAKIYAKDRIIKIIVQVASERIKQL